jgi:hypothetical protein
MAQHTPSPTDQQQPAQHPLEETDKPLDRDQRSGPSGLGIGILALIPLACCGLPVLLAAGVTAGSGAVLGGITAGVLILVGAAILGTWVVRRRARATGRADTGTGTPPTRDDCCREA